MEWNFYSALGCAGIGASVAVAVGCVIRGWRKGRARGAARVCIATATGAVILGLGGTIAGLLTAFDPVEGASIGSIGPDIAQALTCTGFGLVAMLPPAIAAAVLFVRAPSKRSPAH